MKRKFTAVPGRGIFAGTSIDTELREFAEDVVLYICDANPRTARPTSKTSFTLWGDKASLRPNQGADNIDVIINEVPRTTIAPNAFDNVHSAADYVISVMSESADDSAVADTFYKKFNCNMPEPDVRSAIDKLSFWILEAAKRGIDIAELPEYLDSRTISNKRSGYAGCADIAEQIDEITQYINSENIDNLKTFTRIVRFLKANR